MSITAALVIFLSLTSSIGFAAWTASTTKTATATAGTIAVSTAPSGGTGTITALGPFTYTSTAKTVTKPITVRNTGTVEATLSSITMSRTGSLPGSQIDVKFWAGTSSACASATPTVSNTLDVTAPVSLTSLGITIAASGSATLCASTTFTGSMTTYAGQTTTAVFAVNTIAGTLWTATDSLAPSSRTFTQDVYIVVAPNAPTGAACTPNADKNLITISWNAPSGFAVPNGGYNVYWNGTSIGNVTSTSTLVANKGNTGTDALMTDTGNSSSGANTGSLTVRAVASNGLESVDSAAIPIKPENGNSGIACGP